MGKRLTSLAAVGVLAMAALFGTTNAARADHYTYVPRTVWVVKYDHCGNKVYVAYTVYVRVLVRTGY